MNNAILRKEEQTVLDGNRKRARVERLVQRTHRPIPKEGNTILVRPIFLRKNRFRPDTVRSLQLGAKAVVILETIRDLSWSEAIKLWLEETLFKDLTRAVVPSDGNWKTLFGFVVILRGDVLDYNREDFDAELVKACQAIVDGRKLKAEYMKRFKFAIVREELLKKIKPWWEEDEFLKKNEVDPNRDILIVISSDSCCAFEQLTREAMEEIFLNSPHEENAEEEENTEEEVNAEEQEVGDKEETELPTGKREGSSVKRKREDDECASQPEMKRRRLDETELLEDEKATMDGEPDQD